MPFQPGNKLGKGRPRGSVNTLAEEAKKRIARVGNRGLDNIEADLDKIREKDPVEAAKIYLKLLEFIVPKPKVVELKGQIEQKIQQVTVNVNGNTINGNNS